MTKRFTSKAILRKGGETMRTFGFVVALVALTCVASFAATATLDVYSGWQTIGVPLVPLDPQPNHVLNLLDWDGDTPSLNRYNGTAVPPGYETYNYDYATGYDAAFGGLLLGEGYYLFSSSGASMTVTGLENGVPATPGGAKTDMWISLPKAGWNLVANPYAQELAIDQDTGVPFSFTDGTVVKSWPEAVNAGWVGEVGQRVDPASGLWIMAGINYYEEWSWKQSTGYFLNTGVDNLALIITAPSP